MKKQVLISQPMKRLSEEEIRSNRERIVAALEGMGCEVLDSVFDYEGDEYTGMKNKPMFYLAKSLELIATKADAVVFMDGWDEARGCKIEYDVCVAYNVPVYFETI